MSSWLSRAACIACAGAVLGATARAQDLPIRRWLVRGSIHTDTGAARLTRDYLGGETTVLPDSGDVVGGGAFVPVDADSLGAIDLLRVFAGSADRAAAYVHAYVYAPEDRTVLLVMDSDDDLVAWLNGQRVWLNDVARGLRSGSDTVPVRLASGWNSLLLKPVNRTAGFGVLGRLARAPGEPPLDGIRTAYRRPEGVGVAHIYPSGTITASALRLSGAATWNRDHLELPATVTLTAWGRDTLAAAIARLAQAGTNWASDSVSALVPADPRTLRFQATFDDLRRAALALCLGSVQLCARQRGRTCPPPRAQDSIGQTHRPSRKDYSHDEPATPPTSVVPSAADRYRHAGRAAGRLRRPDPPTHDPARPLGDGARGGGDVESGGRPDRLHGHALRREDLQGADGRVGGAGRGR